MGRLESLTAWALGRTPYEDETLDAQDLENGCGKTQLYDEHGHPRNPETRRRERELVRAANEVMQVTGVVEDSTTAKARARAFRIDKNDETLTGLNLMEAGRAVLVAGVWGTMGLRKRILLYQSYSQTGILGVLRHERALHSDAHLILSGLPAVAAFNVADWASFPVQIVIGVLADEKLISEKQQQIAERFCDVLSSYITVHLRMFAVLQQLEMIPATRHFPSLRSFVPFSAASPLQLPPTPLLSAGSVSSWAVGLLRTATPMLTVLAHIQLKLFLGRILYRPIYKFLPRPIGESLFADLDVSAPTMEYDTPDQPDRTSRGSGTFTGEDEATLRALEGRPTSDSEPRMRHTDTDSVLSDDEDGEMAHATLISFDVEATEAVENSLGTWSAELRSANEPIPPLNIEYRVTGLTMLPTFLATEALRETICAILVLPLEVAMVRVLGRAYRQSAGLGVSDLFAVRDRFPRVDNLYAAFILQLTVTGVVWAGFTAGTQWWAKHKRRAAEDREIERFE